MKNQLTNIANKILTDKKVAPLLIKQFQELAWNLKDSSFESEVFARLAYDLDFYEPNAILRKEDPSFYDNEKLSEIVKEAIEKISSK